MFLKNVNLKSFAEWKVSDNSIKIRIFVLEIFFLLLFGIIIYRLISISFLSDDDRETKFEKKPLLFRREIVDRNDVLLAANIESYSLYANPKKIIDPKLCVDKLSTLFPSLSKDKLLNDLKLDKNFIWIKRDLLSLEKDEVFNLGIVGLGFEEELKRIYHFDNLTSHILGFVGRDFKGLAGAELYFNDFLSSDLEQSLEEPLKLSIDIRLQNILEQELSKTILEFDAAGGVGIIANPNNGEILALVNKPDFSPYKPYASSPESLFNQASLGIYEMGSVFKSISLAIAFDTDSIRMNDAYNLTYMKIYGFNVRDTHPVVGWYSIPDIFLKSSNIGVSQIMLEVGKENFRKYLLNLGFGSKLKLELPELGTPLMTPNKLWTDLTTAIMSYGYSISISPLHFVQAASAIVNGGILYDLTLQNTSDKELLGQRVFKKSTSDKMRELFRIVVKEGTGKKADVKGYLVGGKTGTAEKILNSGAGKKKYSKNNRRSSFVGTFPTTNPQYIIFVMIDEPHGIKETYGFAGGGWVAAPLVGRVIEKIIALYGILPPE